MKFNTSQIAEIIEMREAKMSFGKIAREMGARYGVEVSDEWVRQVYLKYEHIADPKVKESAINVKLLQETIRARKANNMTAKKERDIIQYLNNAEDVLSSIDSLVDRMSQVKVMAATPAPADPKKRNMTVEVLISDIHIGKKSNGFGDAVCVKRLDHYRDVVLAEIERKQQAYNVERIVLGFLGDNIENALMHGRESQMGCEFGNPEQVSKAIEYFITKFIVPIASLGLPMDVVGIAGNHDREEQNKTYHLPGKNSLNWVIFQTLQSMTAVMGLKNVKWYIPEGSYHVLEIYKNHILYEHGDRIKGGHSRRSYTNHIADRSMQYGKPIHGLRIGHIHSHEVHENGKVVVNASVCGPDSYSEEMAFTSIAGQVINFYVDTKNRSSAYYHSFLVQLEHIK